MCTCSIFVCRHKNNDMSTLLGHAHTYIPADRQTDTQAYIHKSIQTYSYTYTWLHMCDVSPLWGGGWGGTRGGWIIYSTSDPRAIGLISSQANFLDSRCCSLLFYLICGREIKNDLYLHISGKSSNMTLCIYIYIYVTASQPTPPPPVRTYTPRP